MLSLLCTRTIHTRIDYSGFKPGVLACNSEILNHTTTATHDDVCAHSPFAQQVKRTGVHQRNMTVVLCNACLVVWSAKQMGLLFIFTTTAASLSVHGRGARRDELLRLLRLSFGGREDTPYYFKTPSPRSLLNSAACAPSFLLLSRNACSSSSWLRNAIRRSRSRAAWIDSRGLFGRA